MSVARGPRDGMPGHRSLQATGWPGSRANRLFRPRRPRPRLDDPLVEAVETSDLTAHLGTT